MADLKQQLLALTLKHIQGRVFEADEYYKALEPLGTPSSYAETLVDVFWLLWVRFEVGRGPESLNLVAAIKACWQDKRVSEKQLLQVLEPDCLHTVGLVRDKGAWDKKAVRYNTRLNYTILKYNLLREDSEGYAKLVTLYNHFGSGAVGEPDMPSLARELHSLIGSFDLDPNRCLDLLLDAAAAQPANTALLGAVSLLKAEAVGQLLGFKLQQYQDPSRPPAPRNLLLVAAQLVRTGRTPLLELLGHLAPSDEQQAAGQRAAREALMRRVADIGTINLGGGGGAGGGDDAAGDRAGGRGGGAAAGGQLEQAGRGGGGGGGGVGAGGSGGRSTGLSAAFFELDPSAAVGQLALGPEPSHNQPLALLDALLQVGAWDAAVELHDRLVALGATPAAHPPISAALCRLLAEEVAPAYGALLPQGVLGRNALWGDVPPAPSGAPPQLSPLALRLLTMLGLYIHRDVRLFTKVVRLVRYQLAYPAAPADPLASTSAAATAAEGAAPTTATTTATAVVPAAAAAPASNGPASGPAPRGPGRLERGTAVEDLLATVLLPAVSCCPVHLPLAADVWECIKLLPVQTRYRMYAEFRELAQSHPLLQAAWRLATVETKKVLKRLVLPTDPQKKKEACRPHARMVAKVAHANPLPVMEAIVTQIEVYDNQIEVSLEALKYLSPFSYDVLTFVILSRLAMERDKVKEDGVNISGWLQALARFTGAACRRFSDLDVGAVLQFLVNTLRAGDSFDLLVLQQIIVAMTGVRLEAVLSDEQLDALSGGPELVAEAVVLDAGEADAALGMGRTATSKDLAKGRQRLLRALEDSDGRRVVGASGGGSGGSGSGSLTLPLLVLTAQQRSIIVNHTDSKLIKFIATMYDRCQETLLHLTEFLRLALPVESYADMLPTPDVLRREYGIDVEAVWHIYRPVMSRLLDAAAPQPAEEGELEEGEEGAVAPGSSGDAAAPREEPRVGDKTWAGVLAELPACAGNTALWQLVTPELYASFWSLQLQDIYVPVKRYEKELSAVRDQLTSLENNYLSYIRPGLQNSSGYVSNNVQQQYEAYKAEKASLLEKQSRLSGELEQRRRHVDEVRSRLSLQRASLFIPRVPAPQAQQAQQQAQTQQAAAAAQTQPAAEGTADGANKEAAATGVASPNANGGQKAAGVAAAGAPATAGAGPSAAGTGPGVGPARPLQRMALSNYYPMAQEMLLPRLLFSAADSLYCARFLLTMHHLDVRHFSLINVLDSSLRAIIPVLRALTEVEANNLGVFLFEILKQLVTWHRDEKLFMEDCIRKASTPANSKQTPYNLFKHKMFMWHGVISATFRASIESGDYTQIANALSVMGRLVTVWPGTIPAANSFRGWVEKLQKEDPREDIKTMARSYLIALNREMEKPGRMMSQAEYAGPLLAEKQRPAGAAASGAAARGAASGSSPAGAAKGSATAAARTQGGQAAGDAAAGGDPAGSKPLNAAAKPFVPKGLADGAAGQAGSGTQAQGDGDDGGQGRGAAAAAAAAAARKRPRTEGGKAEVGEKGADGAAAGLERAATDGGGGGKKQRMEAGGGAAGGGAGEGAGGKSRADRGEGDTFSDAGGRAGSETSGRGADGPGAVGSGGQGREGKPEKEHKEHKRSKDKDREKDRSGKDKDKDKERKGDKADKADKEHREGDKGEKEESRREEKERRREEKERERAERAEEAGKGGARDRGDKAAGAAAANNNNNNGNNSNANGAGGGGRDREVRASSAERSRAGGDAGGSELRRGGGGGAAAGGDAGQSVASRERGRDRHGGRRSAAAEEVPERDRDTPADGTGGGKRRRVDNKSDGGGSPGHGGGAAARGSTTPDVGGSRRTDAEMEYDERGGFALPPAPAPRAGGGGAAAAAGGARGAGGGGGGGASLPPPARSGGGVETRRRSGR